MQSHAQSNDLLSCKHYCDVHRDYGDLASYPYYYYMSINLVVRSTHGLISAFFPLERLFDPIYYMYNEGSGNDSDRSFLAYYRKSLS